MAQLLLLTLAVQAALGWLTAVGCHHFSDYGPVALAVFTGSGLLFATMGGLILFHRPDNRIGWFCLWNGIGLPTLAIIELYLHCGLAGQLAADRLIWPGPLTALALFSSSCRCLSCRPCPIPRGVSILALAQFDHCRPHHRPGRGRRIRRDLHNELGPIMGRQTFAVDAILDLLENNPPGSGPAARPERTKPGNGNGYSAAGV